MSLAIASRKPLKGLSGCLGSFESVLLIGETVGMWRDIPGHVTEFVSPRGNLLIGADRRLVDLRCCHSARKRRLGCYRGMAPAVLPPVPSTRQILCTSHSRIGPQLALPLNPTTKYGRWGILGVELGRVGLRIDPLLAKHSPKLTLRRLAPDLPSGAFAYLDVKPHWPPSASK